MLIINKNHKSYTHQYTVQAKELGMGRGWKAEAKDVAEVTLAVAHYYEGHHNNGQDIDECPFCRHSAKERKKLAKNSK